MGCQPIYDDDGLEQGVIVRVRPETCRESATQSCLQVTLESEPTMHRSTKCCELADPLQRNISIQMAPRGAPKLHFWVASMAFPKYQGNRNGSCQMAAGERCEIVRKWTAKTVRNRQPKKCEDERKSVKTIENGQKQAQKCESGLSCWSFFGHFPVAIWQWPFGFPLTLPMSALCGGSEGSQTKRTTSGRLWAASKDMAGAKAGLWSENDPRYGAGLDSGYVEVRLNMASHTWECRFKRWGFEQISAFCGFSRCSSGPLDAGEKERRKRGKGRKRPIFRPDTT